MVWPASTNGSTEKKKFNFIRWLKDVVKGLGGNTPVVQIEIVRESDFKKVHISFKYLFNT